jgi:hypothetical protein
MNLPNLHTDILGVILNFTDACDQYILITYFPSFRLLFSNKKKIFRQYKIIKSAIKSCNIQLIELLMRKSSISRPECPIYKIVKHGNLDVLKWYGNKWNDNQWRSRINEYIRDVAAYHGRLDMLTWILKDFGASPREIMHVSIIAIARDHLNVVRWLCDNQEIKIDRMLEYAIEENKVDIAMWLYVNYI